MRILTGPTSNDDTQKPFASGAVDFAAKGTFDDRLPPKERGARRKSSGRLLTGKTRPLCPLIRGQPALIP